MDQSSHWRGQCFSVIIDDHTIVVFHYIRLPNVGIADLPPSAFVSNIR